MSDISTKLSAEATAETSSRNDRQINIPEKYRNDYILVQNILNNNEEEWKNFILKTQNFLYYTIKKVINKTSFDFNTKQKALNLADDLFLDFYEHLLKNDMRLFRMYKGNSKLSSYLYVCLSNFIYDFFKSKKWKSYINEISASELGAYIGIEEDMSISNIVDKFADNEKGSYNPESELYKKEIAQIIDNLVSSLSENEQLYFNLLFVDGLKPSEASLILGVSAFDVSQMKYRIKEKLKKVGKDKIQEFLDGQ